MKLDPLPPRYLKYRNHYKVYVLGFFLIAGLILSYWFMKLSHDNISSIYDLYTFELLATVVYFITSGAIYFGWLKSKFKRSVQVFEDHILTHNGKSKEALYYKDIESLNIICWSVFYIKMKDGIKHYFNSSLERVDYIWEGLHNARPDLITDAKYDEYRIKLIQYDHHQKRKDWFFKHKLLDVFFWGALPVLFLILAYLFQSKNLVIHQHGLYFFRLFMYSIVALLSVSFVFSILLKKLIFDKKIKMNINNSEDKARDIEFEGVVLQRSKMLQVFSTCFILALLIKFDLNLYSVSKVREDIASFKLKKGHTILVDNRYNCIACKYQVQDGDFVLFGRGIIGQVLAKEGDMVGQIAQDQKGRMIASENIQEVPKGHIAVKAANGKDIEFVRLNDLIGKIQN